MSEVKVANFNMARSERDSKVASERSECDVYNTPVGVGAFELVYLGLMLPSFKSKLRVHNLVDDLDDRQAATDQPRDGPLLSNYKIMQSADHSPWSTRQFLEFQQYKAINYRNADWIMWRHLRRQEFRCRISNREAWVRETAFSARRISTR